jgi:hypothetical protein
MAGLINQILSNFLPSLDGIKDPGKVLTSTPFIGNDGH